MDTSITSKQIASSAAKFNKSVPILPVEHVFTKHDAKETFSERDDFIFDHALGWVQSKVNKKSIGIRRLNLFPSSHTFSLKFDIYGDPDVCVMHDAWIDLDPETYSTKPALWEPGTHYIGPVYSKTIDPTVNVFETTIFNEHVTVTKTNAYKYLFRFVNTFNNGKYESKISIRESVNKVEEEFYSTRVNTYSITENNNIVEFIHGIVNELNSYTYPTPIKFNYEYDSSKGSLVIKCDHDFEIMDFEISELNDVNIIELIKCLNQPITYKNFSMLQTRSPNKAFSDNVWNRKQAFFHTSFSNCNRRYIGCNNDFWSSPTKKFTGNDETEFTLFFTTDAKHKFTPRYCDFIVELVYIYNTDNVEIQL